jgi:serine/tyrosine/threonine adenylyltransferase
MSVQWKEPSGWHFDNSYLRLPRVFYSQLNPVRVPSPKLVQFNKKLAVELGLDADALNSGAGAMIFSGNELPDGAQPIAQAYAGHQFGTFTILGDGRALLLGELLTPSGERLDLQLKGSGRTPYSRGGDGRATLGPMLREYILSEAMYGLGIPTTRSLAVVTTGEWIRREKLLPGAVLARVAGSHIRVGTYEYAAHMLTPEEVRTLADYTIERHFPEIELNSTRYLSLLQGVIKKQAALIAMWQIAGFIHGVMNTDNMAVSGETIDYGPCAFMDAYDPGTVFSSIDQQGRYAFGNQPGIASWNLARFAETLLPLLNPDMDEAVSYAVESLKLFPTLFQQCWLDGLRAKLGLYNQETDDEKLVKELLNIMKEHCLDYTNTFIDLTVGKKKHTDIYRIDDFQQWSGKWQTRTSRQPHSRTESQQLMMRSNPAVIPRNHRVEAALEAAVESDDYSLLKRLLSVLENPYAHSPEQEAYAVPPEPSNTPYKTYCGT